MRLTEKNEMARYGYKYVAPNRFDNFGEGCQKLGQLENIEEEFHIDLINRVCFFKTAGEEIMKVNVIGIGFRDGILVVETEQKKNVFALKQEDYGKTWALTKEELLCE